MEPNGYKNHKICGLKTKLQLVEPIEVRGQNAKSITQSTSLAVTQFILVFRHWFGGSSEANTEKLKDRVQTR